MEAATAGTVESGGNPEWWGTRSQRTARHENGSGRLIVDIGCGNKKVAEAVGVDAIALPGVDIVHDLDRYPYPFAADSVDEIHVSHVLEHLHDVVATMEELWRICKPGATVHIRVPHYTGALAWKDPTHRRSFTSESFRYFGENSYSYYSRARFQVVSTRLRYSIEADRTRRLMSRLIVRTVQWCMDRHSTFGERYLAFLVGGIDEIQVCLKAIKPTA
jgi:SAM-dependent methyltransferase